MCRGIVAAYQRQQSPPRCYLRSTLPAAYRLTVLVQYELQVLALGWVAVDADPKVAVLDRQSAKVVHLAHVLSLPAGKENARPKPDTSALAILRDLLSVSE